MERVKGTDDVTPRTYTTIIDGECQMCRNEFTFDPNDDSKGLLGATNGNWVIREDENGLNRKFAVCPHCGHQHKTDIFH